MQKNLHQEESRIPKFKQKVEEAKVSKQNKQKVEEAKVSTQNKQKVEKAEVLRQIGVK